MLEDNDFIIRQIRAAAEGMAYILGHGKSTGRTEIVFPQDQRQKLPHQNELQQLIDQHQYAQAAERLLKYQRTMADQDFVKLGNWFYDQLNSSNRSNRPDGMLSKQTIIAGLRQLSRLKLDADKAPKTTR
ncbi:MAG: DUF6483 family protein [Lentilactobacillus diolivorans]|jgi:hypothetical protein|uniref:DUF6483 family protein n=1 Tax=Lentilactobacillus diolivorans TaxID=179838 RepID=UPI000FF600FC|nr:DUF6483 family protein [Lentilactobacillus diolivorans]MCH4165440.1 DUF6483 family protein [Lentilactobacillus diolivorans]MDH5105299.1 DUF6483 family protein [Lentilactobacillus diolivorans]RRG02286.1 MAG: hypothetical protein DUD34_09155 [Lactobacillus sp.]